MEAEGVEAAAVEEVVVGAEVVVGVAAEQVEAVAVVVEPVQTLVRSLRHRDLGPPPLISVRANSVFEAVSA